MGLEEYRKKRDFGRTPEPSGAGETDTGVGRGGQGGARPADGVRGSDGDGLAFVVQKHAASHLHYDFRLELDGTLKSWAVPKGPSLKPGVRRLAMETEDHPLGYGEFEGVIPEDQYGGGTVMLWDRGTWEPDGDDPAGDYRRGRLRFRLHGEKLGGSWILTRIKPKPGEKKNSWLLIKSRDEAARGPGAAEITEDEPRSVATGRDLEEIAANRDRVWQSDRDGGDGESGGASPPARSLMRPADPSGVEGTRRAALPRSPEPQLARLASEAPAGEEWLHEMKFDGYRVLCRLEAGEVRILTRNGKDWTDRFEGVASALRGLPAERALVDGEVVVLDEAGKTSFQLLQNSLAGSRAGEPLLYVFDLLHLDGWELTGAALEDRKALLEPLVDRLPRDRVRFSDHVRGQGPDFFRSACGMGLEGIIAKRAASKYRGGRSGDWLKVKCTSRQELVVVGYTEPSGSRVGLGALLLGVHDEDGALVYAGKVGTGFDTATLERLERRLSSMERADAPVADPPRGYRARGVHWVRPELVAEIEFTEWTDDGRIRHPSFQGLREDKRPEDVVREAPGGTAAGEGRPEEPASRTQRDRSEASVVEETDGELRAAGVRISSPDKVLWSGQGVTKRELVEYYVAVETAVLPRLEDRPLTLVRCPSGAEKKCFFQKHAKESMPEVIPRVQVEEQEKTEPYMYVRGLPSLLALVQLGVLEFHTWGSRRDRLDRPDRLVFDLDPDEGLPYGRLAEAALGLRGLLRELGLESWPKSTGGKGLHVVVPITRRNDWDEVRSFTQAVAGQMVRAAPERFTDRMSKSRREGRIFVDYLRNARNSTAIAEYSTRARPGAPVAVPLLWDEVDPAASGPPTFTIRDVPARLEELGDPWTGFDEARQSITRSMRSALGME